MARALALARSARGTTSPNPPVGAVLVRDGEIAGEGRTQPPGGPHAEIMALRAAGERARGATLYVTLEPCSHWGRTPPCADAVVAAGITAVHFSLLDPNPLVGGQGRGHMEAHGIPVVVGEGAAEAAEIAGAHLHFVRTGRPLLTLVTGVDPDLARADTVLLSPDAPLSGTRPALPLPPSGKAELEPFLTRLAREGRIDLALAAGPELAADLVAQRLPDRVMLAPSASPPPGYRPLPVQPDPKAYALLERWEFVSPLVP